MPTVHAQITRTVLQADPPHDWVVNDVYHTIDAGGFNPSTDYQNHANEIRDLFSGHAVGSGSTFNQYSFSGLLVKVYDLADAKPRQPRAQATYTPTSWGSAPGPRQVALCLSYWGVNPQVRSDRGRIYIGPQPQNVPERPATALQVMLVDLGHGLFDIGGENVAHVVHSTKHGTDTVVSHYWCNDVWDTIRGRLQRESARQTLKP